MTPEEANERLRQRRSEIERMPVVEDHLDVTSAMSRIRIVSDREAESLRRQQPEHSAYQRELYAEATLPALHESKTDLNHSGPWGRTLQFILGRIGTGFTVALIGTRGAGKTQIGDFILRTGINRGMRSKFISVTRLFMEVKATYSKAPKESEIQVIDRFIRYKLLVIDEVSRRPEKDWNDQLLFEILNARYNAQHGTLLISNETKEGFAAAIGSSIIDRMTETGGIIECNWASFRKPTNT
jgi:hypothetical protein